MLHLLLLVLLDDLLALLLAQLRLLLLSSTVLATNAVALREARVVNITVLLVGLTGEIKRVQHVIQAMG